MIYFNSDYRKASIATILTELFKFFSSYVLVYSGINTTYITGVIYTMSILLHYTLDIFIVRTFNKDENQFIGKANWYLKSFVRTNFLKYLIYALLHFLVSQNIIMYIKKRFDKFDVKHKYRDIILELLLNVLLFALYGYFLKFKWAYVDTYDPIMTMIVLNWCTLSLMIYTVSNQIK